MKKLEDYINFDLHEIPEVCNYIAVDDDGEVWAYETMPVYVSSTKGYFNCTSSKLMHYIDVLLTEEQVKELGYDRIIEVPRPKPTELNKLSNLHSLSHGEMTTLHTILSSLPTYYSDYVFTVLQSLDSTINTLTTELEDERVARSRLSKELKLIAQELE